MRKASPAAERWSRVRPARRANPTAPGRSRAGRSAQQFGRRRPSLRPHCPRRARRACAGREAADALPQSVLDRPDTPDRMVQALADPSRRSMAERLSRWPASLSELEPTSPDAAERWITERCSTWERRLDRLSDYLADRADASEDDDGRTLPSPRDPSPTRHSPVSARAPPRLQGSSQQSPTLPPRPSGLVASTTASPRRGTRSSSARAAWSRARRVIWAALRRPSTRPTNASRAQTTCSTRWAELSREPSR